MGKRSIVKDIKDIGYHKDQYGLKYDFEIEMENGNKGIYSTPTKDQKYFIINREVEYLFIVGKKYNKIKISRKR